MVGGLWRQLWAIHFLRRMGLDAVRPDHSHKPDFHPRRLIAAAFEAVGSPLLNPSANVWRITPRLTPLHEPRPVSALSVPY